MIVLYGFLEDYPVMVLHNRYLNRGTLEEPPSRGWAPTTARRRGRVPSATTTPHGGARADKLHDNRGGLGC